MTSELRSPHTGILCEENIAVRQILGYHLKTLKSSPFKLPQIGAYVPGTIKDILITSIDLDTGGGYEAISSNQSFHISVSILDTRCLIEKLDNPRNVITSYQFINRETQPCKRVAKRFLFGEIELMTLPDIAKRISFLTKDQIVNRACYVLDTVKAAQFPLQLAYPYSIEKLLNGFGIGYAKLHVAGNDAHFTLKVLLMIAVYDGRRTLEMTLPEHEELFYALDAIAHAPCNLPVWSDEPPVTSTPPKKGTKLGIKAKRRLQLERRKAAIQAAQDLASNDKSTEQQSKDEQK